MFIHTRGSAAKRFAKLGRQKQTFCGKNRKKRLANSSQTDYRLLLAGRKFNVVAAKFVSNNHPYTY